MGTACDEHLALEVHCCSSAPRLFKKSISYEGGTRTVMGQGQDGNGAGTGRESGKLASYRLIFQIVSRSVTGQRPGRCSGV
jgi:hypothetical protein